MERPRSIYSPDPSGLRSWGFLVSIMLPTLLLVWVLSVEMPQYFQGVGGMSKMGPSSLPHLKAPGSGHSIPQRASVTYHQERIPSPWLELCEYLQSRCACHWEKIQVPQGSLLTGKLPTGRRLLAIPALTKASPGFPRGKQRSKSSMQKDSQLPHVSQ